ncbi:hypothetical protein BATDEDRAFT_88007 [Batrachochytrium dendrobatidis JAM81]|uniref:Protein kinase domain-containing protein n=1 Tax=Batrachochytrium dendrobatidis (strain JAM81 / FGSC 10211) TaxID=684364 RepID=F4P1P0_BATDJ|nr:uncharacterized protein BATDEDRAFT_88007 [Batrachochytrium dendrobatidis JAM81]EGF80939.1 hypothetical protein BATDEDRAFT_88007 [Batrachochytrium dendrobatidis JAM81]|eukprot:XP_006678755.1 hypothetical protein BATDEDRAFT_88007 [Batrachochytrium dendrobatidis JAM81]
MGNALAGQFEVQEQIGSSDRDRLWLIRKAISKNNGKPCAVWAFDRSDAEKRNPLARQSNVKNEMAIISNLFKREVQLLTKLRHPSIVQVQESLQELRTLFAFATEPLIDTLSNVLVFSSSARSGEQQSLQSGYELDSLEIQKGLRQIANGLQFLHSAGIIHMNLCPDAIVINPMGDWKISGFQFAVTIPSGSIPSQETTIESAFNPAQQPNCCTPDLAFIAPEIVLNGQCSSASDVWSLGILIHALFNNGRPLFECNGNSFTYRERANEMLMIGALQLRNVSADLEGITISMLPMNPQSRITLEQFQNSHYFENVLMSTLEKPELEKAKFLKALPGILPRFPEKIVTRKILSLLLNELKSIGIAPFVLPSIFWILERASGDALTITLHALKPLFQVTDPPQCSLLLLSKVELLLSKLSKDAVPEIIQFVLRSMESQHLGTQDAAVKSVLHILSKTDMNCVRNIVLPKLETTFQKTTAISTKVNCLIAVHAMVKILDKLDIIDRVLPMLERNRSEDVGITMAMLVVYEGVSTKVDCKSIALFLIPSLWRNSTQKGLNNQQFMRFMTLIDRLSLRVKEEMLKIIEAESVSAQTPKLDKMISQGSSHVPGSLNPGASLASTALQLNSAPRPNASASAMTNQGWNSMDWSVPTASTPYSTQASQRTINNNGLRSNTTSVLASNAQSSQRRNIVNEFDPLKGK